MKPRAMSGYFFCVVLMLILIGRAAAEERRCESWQTGYSGSDASGPHVLGYWQFRPGAVTRDASGRGHELKLAGAVAAAQGRFDGALESFPGWPVADKRHAAVAAAEPALSPKGAFTLEMWIKPQAGLTAELSPVLIDKKYVANTDYQWRLSAADKGGARRMLVILGYGEESETFGSEAFQPGTQWQHIAFTYDGAGEVRFFRNGAALGTVRKAGRGAVMPGKQQLSIGDRLGSNYAGFPGLIDEVRLCAGALEFRPVAVTLRSMRKTWLRMEKAEPVTVAVRNLGQVDLKGGRLQVSIEGVGGQKTFELPALEPGATREVAYALDTTLRPDAYRLKARLELAGPPPYASDEAMEFTIAARPLAKMPVMMWGLYSPAGVTEELARLKDLGFTHCLGLGGPDCEAIWQAGKPIAPGTEEQIASARGMLDLALANDLGIAMTLSPGQWLKTRKDVQRVDRTGKPYAARGDVNAALPGLAEFCYNVGASFAQAYDKFPAWQAALIDTEVRDSTQLSFSAFDREAYRKFAGADIPAEVVSKNGVKWADLKGFPADRIIPDDHPVLKYYRWFWTVGDGWNGLHSAVHRGIHSTGRGDVWTWFDPAIRAPSVGGSGGEVDALGQWTYTSPDPLRIGYFADELLTMAANSPRHPRVMKMTQLFWYRSQTAPQKSGAGHVGSPFDDHDPDAAYITISPMHLRESFWTKLARPVSGIMYHGWQALVPTASTGGYRYTHPDTKEEFRRLHRGVLEPLGPTLLRLGEPRRDVAYLDSFTAQMFAGRGGYGYSGDEAYQTLLYAQLQPEVLYEDQVAARGLEGYKVLVLADCDVLPAKVAARIREWQGRGGLVIRDENLAPGIKADIIMAHVKREKKGDADKAALLAAAARLRAALDAKYARAVDSTNPEIVTRRRVAGEGEYVFVVNDHREFGEYVGQHGIVMDNGLPSAGEVSLARAGGCVFDLVAGREVAAVTREGKLRWPVALGPCDGRVYMITPRPIAAVKIGAPEAATRGAVLAVNVTVADGAGQAVPAAVPVRVEISDPAGRAGEFSGYYGAENGQVALRLELAPNDATGLWQIRATELASGKAATAYVRVGRK